MATASVALSGCLSQQVFERLPAAVANAIGVGSGNSDSGNVSIVCNPLGGSSSGSQYGLKGDLYYADSHSPAGFNSIADFLNSGVRLDASLYLSRLYVPTQPFSSGFQGTDGNYLRDSDGNLLIENFGMKLKSDLVLRDPDPDRHFEGDPEGRYEIALLADDGAQLIVKDLSSSGDMIVNIDGVHSTKMGCPSRNVQMTRGHSVPIEVRYFQGPRYHVALIMMWRLQQPNSGDPNCGIAGNDYYFDSTQSPPAQNAGYRQLLERGWRPVAAENFLLQNGEQNPCAR